jgi:phosphatidylglycerophosphatase A
MTNPDFKTLISKPEHFFAFGFGSGLAPKAPGTFGTLAAVPIFLLIQPLSWPLYLSWLLVAFALGVYWCDRSSKALGVHDHGGIVWDEMVGYWLTMFLAPAGWLWMLVGFLLFRLFDIVKPWPIGWLDRQVKGGLGIMIDDIVAALYAWICLQLLAWFWFWMGA